MHPEIRGLLTLACAFFTLLALVSFVHEDPGADRLGLAGYYVALALLYTFGMGAYLVVGYVVRIGWKLLAGRGGETTYVRVWYFFLFLISLCFLLNWLSETVTPPPPFLQKRVFGETYIGSSPPFHKSVRFNVGGVPCYYLYCDLPLFNLARILSHTGVFIVFSITTFLSVVLFADLRIFPLFSALCRNIRSMPLFLCKRVRDFGKVVRKKGFMSSAKPLPCVAEPEGDRLSEYPLDPDPEHKGDEAMCEEPEGGSEEEGGAPPPPSVKVTTLSDRKPSSGSGRKRGDRYEGDYTHYRLPPLRLLTDASKVDQPTLCNDLKKQAAILEETLQSFGINARVGHISCGPTVALFEVLPPVGVKVQKIRVLENDIALNLQARSIRIIAPIPGKAAVGVEIPSPHPQEVGFKEMLEEYLKRERMAIPILLGQTVTGEHMISDLARMPHCIIAGATGSGKSVCINSVVMSILMTARPDEVRLLLIDPKKVELSAYTGLAHMIAPVITEAHGAYAALNWLVKEMQHRYEILKYLKLRNIQSFNGRRIDPEREEALPFDVPRKFPYFVAIIDEFADLMMASSSDLETPIARIAQMARAVGIHLILATQRPSREVITGLIKANFPSRIAFKVASRVNSQIILDENGAEALLGNGDLLFMPPGTANLTRAQGAFVRDEDINRVIRYIESQAHTQYLIRSFDHPAPDDDDDEREDEEEQPRDVLLYEQARAIVTETGIATATFLQRKLSVGYPRAASLIDKLESRGVVTAQEKGRPRQVIQRTEP
ncbi:MAG: DNA translocase FtsK 4TM domain-containing protein [Simkaniaceae bacterium]|nr:DNA translocase FtsK 4TM domain-containing protein [Simkaniaceae bacterium]